MTGTEANQRRHPDRNIERNWFPTRLVRFYIPLPEPLPIGDKWTYLVRQRLDVFEVNNISASGSGLLIPGVAWIEHLNRNTLFSVAEPNHELFEDAKQDPPASHADYGFRRLVRLWHAAGDNPRIMLQLAAVFSVVDRVLLTNPQNSILPKLREMNLTSPKQDYTVAEVVVPLDLNPDHERAIALSFNNALRAVQHLQRSMHVVRRYSTRLATRQLMPETLPYEVGIVTTTDIPTNDLPVASWERNMIGLHSNLMYSIRPGELNTKEYQALDNALYAHLVTSPFLSYLQLRAEANTALDHVGDLRTSIVWSAASIESFLDELLRHMMWELNRRPEDCLREFDNLAITGRVKANFSGFIGGNWDLTRPGVVKKWKDEVADLRNNVVHNMYHPTFEEAQIALDTTNAFVSYVSDLLCTRLETHFRTAIALMGEAGLAQRNKTKRVAELRSKVREPDPIRSFANWRATHERLLLAYRDGIEVKSEASRSTLRFGWGRANRGYWFLHDEVTRQVIRADVDESTIPEHVAEIQKDKVDGPQLTTDRRADALKFHKQLLIKAAVRGDWLEEYHLAPDRGVLRDGLDISDDEYVWRPN